MNSAEVKPLDRDLGTAYRPNAPATCECSLFCFNRVQQDRQYTHDAILRGVYETIFAVEKH